ncbi:hypothetical protein A6U87_22480 [Rhizobium sp. AC44/96]|uniref:hypothetical protein n=1 Tax=Rhizobium sp. AC44/96 TaxID=1841654 RepID=UPI000828BF64|nr:hypothetical protein [Rhizobium sp. AC44/96]OCJ16389.1 hypothetical protein A6U87_22480 [Rhizobium sp. AC44/96]
MPRYLSSTVGWSAVQVQKYLFDFAERNSFARGAQFPRFAGALFGETSSCRRIEIEQLLLWIELAANSLSNAIFLSLARRNFDFAFSNAARKLPSADQNPTIEELYACPSTVAVSTS